MVGGMQNYEGQLRYPDAIEVSPPGDELSQLRAKVAALEAQQGARGPRNPDIIKIISNPGELQNRLNLSDEQANNVSALIAGAGATAGHKYLSDTFGDVIASAMGAAAGAYVARRVMGRKGRR